MNLYLINEVGEMELDWGSLEAVSSPEFSKKVERRYKSEKDNTVLWARSYKGSVEVVLKRPYGVEIFSYNKGDININSLTTSEITEIYQSL